ncbi:histone family DNA-binding [Salmonella phage SeF3a]|nr:histone family DNA-binding [Salmonella phage SeF3a]
MFSDTLHDAKRLSAAHQMLKDNRSCFTNLTLVVFLG